MCVSFLPSSPEDFSQSCDSGKSHDLSQLSDISNILPVNGIQFRDTSSSPAVAVAFQSQRHKSSTYKKLDCVTESGCLNSVFQCNVDSRLCFYSQNYGNGEKTIGFLATDIITFVGDNTQARIIFGCSLDQMSGTSQFVNTYSGIISLGKTPGIYYLPSQLGSNLFALCLPSVEAATGSFLTFNKAPWVYGIEAKLLKNRQQPHLYYINLYKIFINDREVPVDPTWWNGQKEDHGAFVDTGTLISRFPHDYYIIFRYTFREQVHYPLYQRGVFDTCYKEIEGEEEMQFPSVVRMARRTVVSPLPVIVAPPSGIQQKLGPLTFGNFIPGSFQPIREETELVEARVVKHDPGTSSQAPPTQAEVKTEEEKDQVKPPNRSSQMGKALNYIPPMMKGEKLIVQLEEDDILVQANHWSTELIGYVLGDSLFFKTMKNYIAHVWNFVTKPKVKFPSLPLGFWSTESLSKLASVVGTIQQSITYDWIPKFCSDCNCFGHKVDECPLMKEPEKEE
ncbi:hypothetical protein BC332_17897 [Capsicum chinense]|nr:hypothetical protein BC332_17897 [Capsicum chinense]